MTLHVPEASPASGEDQRATRDLDALLAGELAIALDVDRVESTADYFDDLGADSLVMAGFCARLKAHPSLPTISIKDVYRHRSIASLADALAASTDASPGSDRATPTISSDDTIDVSSAELIGRPGRTEPASNATVILCGALQFLALLALTTILGVVLTLGFEWISPTTSWTSMYLRSGVYGGAVFLLSVLLPIAAKWTLIGRWTPREIPVWSVRYVRFWFVKLVIQRNPIILFVGSPIYIWYLRALGTRVGRGAVVLTPIVPVCTDLITIGEGAVVRRDAAFPGYRVQSGIIQTGTVSIGRRAFVGMASTLEIESRLGDDAQLGHSSSLRVGQHVPDGETRVGSPADTRIDHDYRLADGTALSRGRRVGFAAVQLFGLFLFSMPISTLVPIVIERQIDIEATFLDGSVSGSNVALFVAEAMLIALVLLVVLEGARLTVALVVAPLMNRTLEAGREYPLYGVNFWVHRAIGRITNLRFFTQMLGDTSYIVPYLQRLGYDLDPSSQTGANFGMTVVHDNPYAVTIGSGTMVADGLFIANAEYSSTSFRVAPTAIPSNSFLGNNIAFPHNAATGDDCLLGTKAQVPIGGDVRSNTGFLGSPSFEIPRMVDRDREFSDMKTDEDVDGRLVDKNRHNRLTILMFLVRAWLVLFLAIGSGLLALVVAQRYGVIAAGPMVAIGLVLEAALLVFLERMSTSFRDLTPLQCSMYAPEAWRVERFWKMNWQPIPLNGTPFKGPVLRLMGVRIGKRVFDDGATLVDKTMITVGDDCTLNSQAVVQPHSQEDGSFKSAHVTIGAGCTLGIRSFVHYGTLMGDGSSLEADAFLMKGSEIANGSYWGANPAAEVMSAEVAPTIAALPAIAAPAPAPEPAPIPEPTSTPESAPASGPRPSPETASEHALTADHVPDPVELRFALDGLSELIDHPPKVPEMTSSFTAPTPAASAVATDDRAYWHSVLAEGGRTVLPRWTADPARGVVGHEITLTPALVFAVSMLAERLGVGRDAVVLAAHARVLAALTGESDVATGWVASDVTAPLPCRIATGERTWAELVAVCDRRITELQTHRHGPVGEVASELGHTDPVHESVLDLSDGEQELSDHAVLDVAVSGDGRMRLRYRADAYDAAGIARIAGYHQRALEQITADPHGEIVHTSLLSPAEFEFQMHGQDGPHKELPDLRFHELFERRVRMHPDAVAATHVGDSLTYAELNSRANRLARVLQRRGVQQGDVVAVVTERDLHWMAAVLAVFKAGAVYLPIEPHFPADRIATTLTRAGCTMVMTEPGSTGTLYDALRSMEDVSGFFVPDAYDDRIDDSDLGVVVAATDVAYIYFTSGSTGEPKGAMCEHLGMINHLYAKIDDFGIREGDVVAEVAPQCFDISLWQLVSALLVGGRTVIVAQDTILEPRRFLDTIISEGVGVMQVVPSYLEVLLSSLAQSRRELTDLRCVSVTGEAVSFELVQRWFAAMPDIKLANAYGLTETSDDTNHEVMSAAPEHGPVPLGPAVNNVHVRVVDERLVPVPLGAPGEIVFSGMCVGRGYINDPDRTAAAFMDDPLRDGDRLYRSGDFGRWRPDGKLEFLGRRDAQVKIRGFRIEIGEIENAIMQIDGMRQSAVVVVERADSSKQLVGFYAGPPMAVEAVQARLSESLPHYMVPPTIHRRDELPLTGNGKVDKKTLRVLAAELGSSAPGDVEPPATATERRLAETWAKVLGVPNAEIGRTDHFFDRGGSSLSAVEMVLSFGDELSLADVTEAPVLRDLAARVDDAAPRTSRLLQLLDGSDERGGSMLVGFPYAGGNAVNYQGLARSLELRDTAVHAVELPGHDLTGERRPFATVAEVAHGVADEIAQRQPSSVVLWGHSSGAALAIATCRRLLDLGVPVDRVFVGAQILSDAASRAAFVSSLESISDVDIASRLAAGTDGVDLDRLDESRAARVGAAYRHDVNEAFRSLTSIPGSAKLAAPVTVVLAADDPGTDITNLPHGGWDAASDEVDVRTLDDGGHYFLRTRPDAAARIIEATLAAGPAAATALPAPAVTPSVSAPAAATPSAAASTALAPPSAPTATPTSTPAPVPAPSPTLPPPSTVAGGNTFDVVRQHGRIATVAVEAASDPVGWARAHAEDLRAAIATHGSLCVRGLALADAATTRQVVDALTTSVMVEREAFGAREARAAGMQASTVWPPNQQMCMHHELSYRLDAPGMMAFACMEAATEGGDITVADAAAVLDDLPTELVTVLERQGWMLVRNYTDEIGSSVEEVFGTSDRAEIETYCRDQAIGFQWQPDGGLRTWQRRPAVVRHPVTGKRCWFNQVAFLNEWTMKAEVRNFLVELYGPDGLPFTTRFGNGDPIDEDTVRLINLVYDRHTSKTTLGAGDLLLVDNIANAHGRDPYSGRRELLVSLCDPVAITSISAPLSAL